MTDPRTFAESLDAAAAADDTGATFGAVLGAGLAGLAAAVEADAEEEARDGE